MFLNKSFPYTTSSRIHLFIGITLGIFVLFILFYLKPFNSGSSEFSYKTIYLSIYGIIAFATYFVTHLVSIIYYKNIKVWTLFEEITYCLVFIALAIVIAFFYTEIIINKNPDRVNLNHFIGWFEAIFLGFGILLLIATLLLRKHFAKVNLKISPIELSNEASDSPKDIVLYGSLKKEFFQVNEMNLVYIKSENNYVKIFYFEDDSLKEKLIRSTLVNIEEQLPSFVKIHRSYIVNPNFIRSLKGNKQNAKLFLKKTDCSLPISQPFYQAISELLNPLN